MESAHHHRLQLQAISQLDGSAPSRLQLESRPRDGKWQLLQIREWLITFFISFDTGCSRSTYVSATTSLFVVDMVVIEGEIMIETPSSYSS